MLNHQPFLSRRLVCAFVLFAAACAGLPVPHLTFDTPLPPATAAPPPTPLPSGAVTITVRVPAGTPAGSAPAVQVLDELGGASSTVILTNSGKNVWTGSTPAPLGTVLRYKYIRPLPTTVEETNADQQPVGFRLFFVDGNATIVDTVAGWSDVPFAGDVGGLDGRVWNANTGQGVMGILVAAGGKLTVTAHDGSFQFYDLPAGDQRTTLLAPDGSLRPAQKSVTVSAGKSVALDHVSADPNAVHLTFLVRPPPGLDPAAALRLAGNVLQMGDNLFPSSNSALGGAIAAAREPVLVPLADGRWTVRLQLYAGSVLSYKYTLGDGVWDGELDANGDPLVRQLVVPPVDTLVDDTIATWQRPGSPSITFDALTPPDTPGSDILTIQFRAGIWQPPLAMWRISANDWRFVLNNPTDFSGSMFYRYCRNFACGAADDVDTAGDGATGRSFTQALFPQNLRDNINDWQWLGGPDGGGGALPPVNPHPNFAAGFDLSDDWLPNALPFYAQAFDSMRADGAGWVNVTRRAADQPMRPAPVFADDPTLAPWPADWAAIVATAHTVGLRVSLHPVTCAYTPYGACDYWNGVNFGGNFWDTWFAAYQRWLLTQATLAKNAAADQLVIGDFKLRPSFPGEPEAAPDAEARWRSLIGKVREIYKGPLAFELLMGDTVWPSPPPFLDAVDTIRVWWWSPLSTGTRPAIANMTVKAGGLLDRQILPVQQRFNKPVQISAAYLSVDGSGTQCLRRSDGQCYSFEAFAPGAPDVTPYALNMAEQADIYQSLLLAVNARPWVSGFFSYGYNPLVTLRDKSLSVRGKPAETVIAAWLPKLAGR